MLLVEDDEDDAELTRLALARCATPNTLDTVGDGAQAIEWLRGAGGPSGVDLVLVDLKMPVIDGFELLERLRAEHDLEKLAVVVLTTSSRMEDRERAHSLGAHAYVTKEASFPLYRDLLEGLLSDVARDVTGTARTMRTGASVPVAAGDAGQREPERRARAGRRLDTDRPAVALDDPLRRGQPDAGAAQLGALLGPVNTSNTLATCSGGMPIPLSRTEIRHHGVPSSSMLRLAARPTRRSRPAGSGRGTWPRCR